MRQVDGVNARPEPHRVGPLGQDSGSVRQAACCNPARGRTSVDRGKVGTNAEEGALAGRLREEKCRRRSASATTYHSIVTSTLEDARFAASRSHAVPSSSAASAGVGSPSWQVIAVTMGLFAGPRAYEKPSAVRSTVETAFMLMDNYRNEEVDKSAISLMARRTVESAGSFAAPGTRGKAPLSEGGNPRIVGWDGTEDFCSERVIRCLGRS